MSLIHRRRQKIHAVETKEEANSRRRLRPRRRPKVNVVETKEEADNLNFVETKEANSLRPRRLT